jgi:hypothetical protein
VDSALNAANALKCELAGEVLRSSGKLRLRVTGWSMLPSIWPGDTLLIESASANQVFDGEIVLFGRDRRLFVHRVVAGLRAADNSHIITQGDGMPRPDPPVANSALLGRVSHIMRNGCYIEPGTKLRLLQRFMAALVRRSELAARLIVRVHEKNEPSPRRVSLCQS